MFRKALETVATRVSTREHAVDPELGTEVCAQVAQKKHRFVQKDVREKVKRLKPTIEVNVYGAVPLLNEDFHQTF